MMSPEAQAILYDPASYYRPWCKWVRDIEPGQRSALNEHLIAYFKLPDYAPAATSQQSAVNRLLRNWSDIPAAGYLVACTKHRKRMMSDKAYLFQPPAVHAFLRLRFSEVEGGGQPDISTAGLLAWGGQHLQLGLVECLPRWMSARIPLLFADRANPRCNFNDDLDLNCFWSALAYAANDPEFSAALRP